MTGSVSIIIPVHNGESTIGRCLEAAFSSRFENFEVVVVDDASDDRSVEVIKRFPCKLVQLQKHSGAATARNLGAENSQGKILFFTDADCLLVENTLDIAVETLLSREPNVAVGGTYTLRPADEGFYNRFQSVFINYFETIHSDEPDYLATHSMIIYARDFKKSGGFTSYFLPILEDVEFSHRVRRKGMRLFLNPDIQVRHIFGFSLLKSMRNAFKKSMYWSVYSISHGDMLKSSGTASIGLKLNSASWLACVAILCIHFRVGEDKYMVAAIALLCFNVAWNSSLLAAFYRAGGIAFLAKSAAYYLLLYPLAVGFGGLVGLVRYRQLAGLMYRAD